MEYRFEKLDQESLSKLYSEFGYRAKEIGNIVGVTEDAIVKKLKFLKIPTNSRDKLRAEVSIVFTGKRKDKKNELTDEELTRLCKDGITDAAIGDMYNMSGEGIAFRRGKLGIDVSMKYNETQENINKLKNTSKEVLSSDYYNLTKEGFSDKYSISTTVWRPYLKSLGIKDKMLNKVDDEVLSIIEENKDVCEVKEKPIESVVEEPIKNNKYDFAAIEDKMKQIYIKEGVSRGLYLNENLLGCPAYAIEHHYNGWNAFLLACGIEPQYEARSPRDKVKDYLNECSTRSRLLSFYDYEKETGKPATRLKRLFNTGKPYHHLLEEFKSIALKPELWDEFLKKFN